MSLWRLQFYLCDNRSGDFTCAEPQTKFIIGIETDAKCFFHEHLDYHFINQLWNWSQIFGYEIMVSSDVVKTHKASFTITFSEIFIAYKAWMIKYVCAKLRVVNIHPCPKFGGGLNKPPLLLGHGWVITTHGKLWAYLLIHALNIHGVYRQKYVGPIWSRQDPGGPHVGPINFAIWVEFVVTIMSWDYNSPPQSSK